MVTHLYTPLSGVESDGCLFYQDYLVKHVVEKARCASAMKELRVTFNRVELAQRYYREKKST